MSLESALDEERREVLNLLEGRPAHHGISGRSPPPPLRTISPTPPVRSMLDVDPVRPRHASIATANSGITNPPLSAPLTGSMLDPYSPPPEKVVHSAQSSPVDGEASSLHRTRSDASATNLNRPRAGSDNSKTNFPYSKDQFDMTSTVSGQAMPKRVTQGGKKMSSMASIMQGQELEPIFPTTNRDRGRHNSTAGVMGPHSSRSPSSRLNRRSDSPGTRMLNTNSFNPLSVPNRYFSETGKVIDLSNAYRKLSDANFIKSGSTLSTQSIENTANRARLDSGEVLSPTGEVRLQKDYYNEDEEDAVESSDDAPSSDEEAWGVRGRKRGRSHRSRGDSSASTSPRGAQSLLAAAEEERINVSSKYKIKSLLEPTVTVTGPGGERITSKKPGVHPNTNYNAQLSAGGSPVTSDSEDLGDIKRAQKLSIRSSPTDSTVPHRLLRTIIRGEFSRMQQEAEEGSRRLRTYLVATDLSAEAAYALEWTIGTVLRDGDTLLAVYCVDEETSTGKGGDAELSVPGLPVGQGGAAIQETAATMARLTEVAKSSPSHQVHSPLRLAVENSKSSGSRPSSSDSKNMSKAEQARLHAIEDISQTCMRFLRKTKLQVRVAVEVIHCKSPKYMITEAIDVLEPTLVILGSRGRSALKGVLLGSFSNYLVTKSSVPVMVARKKLQKPSAKDKLPRVRLANNLTPVRSLAEAKID